VDAFYGVFAGISLGLLGLWWVAMEAVGSSWFTDRGRYVVATMVTHGFLFTGAMSLLSLATTGPVAWRLAFLLGGGAGALSCARVLRYPDPVLRTVAPLWASAGSLVLFIAIMVVAVVPSWPNSVAGRQIESILFVSILVIGVLLAWNVLTFGLTNRAASADSGDPH